MIDQSSGDNSLRIKDRRCQDRVKAKSKAVAPKVTMAFFLKCFVVFLPETKDFQAVVQTKDLSFSITSSVTECVTLTLTPFCNQIT